MAFEDLAARNTGQNILEIVRHALPDLRKSERKVANRVLEDPNRILNAALAEAAALSDVSEPTVIRFCVAIGCTGYQEFKLKLAHSLALGTTATHSVLSKDDTTAELVEKIFGYTMTSLDWARSHLNTEALGAAIGLLSQARSIEFFGLGASGIVALDAQQKFPLFGVPCGAQADTHQQLMTASMMQTGDVAVIFSNTGHTIAMIEVAEIARKSGAKVIGVSGSKAPLLDYCDVAILVETLDNTDIYTPTISRIAALVVVDILCSAVGLRRDAEHGQRFENMKQLLRNQRLDGPKRPS
ncbi:SIS domain-containing protein [Pararhizobium antarcticum]|uniref:RpiR family transcriptional regulator n=1 Tax=Pararhizobium antarcticum TaxID=1798805 RepID=A0A657LUW0_9HYPH|nr:SIS domain-containing protein [Pararhizobium antarcticum]OJF97674.1 RpiR family transcriptional regulator [Pararhizobium antarcticum]OJF99863.1 RpiR family transcriptional regulator [Rhizobium sp. 58]